ncbi:tripartite tricarboxylate transporter TctB family protein [Bradyrhizobium sp. AUGA SZCCT0431]|uniref:tripartite tricarboxylate transporter TctB family protein n=1 Tax=Bradyrhizobium sp. AUGA SZCCT0431 TaxID=2807674 RepID=UPI001BA4B4A8|nr:tripartite tricarboxylate transporter TctB family protein [Bradyrhizobium sp. AUGA SZCCT0431]MBR1144872.1 tripartite tricarboxylate transporter TctB family protein [Bradyrhizobium sp. AUGA SZCCT0431]
MVSGRSLEAATALITGAFGAAVVVSSLDNGIGWSAAGVESGTFPLIVGLVILAGSLFNLVQGWMHARAVILGPSEFRRLPILFVPAAVFVGVIPLIGMYPAAALYVFGALAWHKRGSLLLAAVAAIGAALALYLMFELTFQISLPRGALGTLFGF